MQNVEMKIVLSGCSAAGFARRRCTRMRILFHLQRLPPAPPAKRSRLGGGYFFEPTAVTWPLVCRESYMLTCSISRRLKILNLLAAKNCPRALALNVSHCDIHFSEVPFIFFFYSLWLFSAILTNCPVRYTGCNRRNGPDFGRVFLMLNYTEKPQNTYIQSW